MHVHVDESSEVVSLLAPQDLHVPSDPSIYLSDDSGQTQVLPVQEKPPPPLSPHSPVLLPWQVQGTELPGWHWFHLLSLHGVQLPDEKL